MLNPCRIGVLVHLHRDGRRTAKDLLIHCCRNDHWITRGRVYPVHTRNFVRRPNLILSGQRARTARPSFDNCSQSRGDLLEPSIDTTVRQYAPDDRGAAGAGGITGRVMRVFAGPSTCVAASCFACFSNVSGELSIDALNKRRPGRAAGSTAAIHL